MFSWGLELLLFLSISQCFIDTTSGYLPRNGHSYYHQGIGGNFKDHQDEGYMHRFTPRHAIVHVVRNAEGHSSEENQEGLWKALHELEDKLNDFEGHEHAESHDHHAVLFSAARSQGNQVTKTAVPIVYDQVELNREEDYNSATGVFSCSNAGVYFFTYTSLPDQGVETSVALLKNDAMLSSIHSDLHSGSAQLAERSELILLQEGDRVWVQLQQGSLQSQAASLKFQGFRVSD